MQTTKTKKMSLMITCVAVLIGGASRMVPDSYFQEVIDNDFIQHVKQKLTAYTAHAPEDRLYVQLDKSMYEPGDDVWLSVFLRDAATLKPSSKSDLVYVELVNPKGTVEKKITVISKNGKAAGDFSIAKEAAGGLYKIRAYTNWMKNVGEENIFEKEIQVQDVILPALKMKLNFERKAFGSGDEVVAKLELNTNENKPLSNYKLKFAASLNGVKLLEQPETTDADGLTYLKFNLPKDLSTNDGLLNVMIDYNGSTESISRAIPIILNTIDLAVYPEGGELLCGFENTVAFRALNEFGKPADVEGIVMNEKGVRLGVFNSYHQGMGSFKLTPKAGEKYTLKITKPQNVLQTINLPQALNRGYAMHLNNSNQGEVSVSVCTSETEELSLIAQLRGKIYYNTVINALKGVNTFTFSTKDFPIGVTQVTLFDSKGIARSERLVFLNKQKQMNISIETDKEKYLPREKVKMTIAVKDDRGIPMPANLSMAVVNDQLLSFADDKSGNILSQLLLQQDIKEKIDEPSFYFNDKEAKSDQALDYLLMTAGWRRFTWEQVMEQELPRINYFGQKALVNGKVVDSQTSEPLACVKITNADGKEFLTDNSGRFSIAGIDLTSPALLSFQSEGFIAQSQYFNMYESSQQINLLSEKSYKELLRQQNEWSASERSNAVLSAPMAAFGANDKVRNRMDRKAPRAIKNLEGAINKKDEMALDVSAPGEKLDEVEIINEDLSDDVNGRRAAGKAMRGGIVQPSAEALYYRARQFAVPHYENAEKVETRTDFRNTIYWNPNVEIGYSGKTTIEFYTSDDITSFRTTIEGIDKDGLPGRIEKNFFTQLPFAMTSKIPIEIATEDMISIPVTLKNNTQGPLGGILTVVAPEGLTVVSKLSEVQTIMPGKAKTIYLDYKVSDKIGEGDLTLSFKCCGLSDALTQHIKIVAKGFSEQVSFSSQDKENSYTFEINNLVEGSLKASFTAFPNVVADLMKGVEGILQEPYGCFEQTSCTAYPNAMVLDYLKNTDSRDNKTLARATDLLDRGYKRLTTFETTSKGYEWFGANPGHEGLTAYGLMEFSDMKKAGQNIDSEMMNRTAKWLLSHKDGKGGFAREQHAFHDFGRISEEIMNGYIVYALSEAGYTEIRKEFETAYTKAIASKDPYQLAMISNAAFSMNEPTMANEALKKLVSLQAKDGSFTGLSHSITYSQGQSLTIETTALSIMAILKSNDKNVLALNLATHYLLGSRSGSGVFSSTQGTILALKALTEYAKFSKKTVEDGSIDIYVDDKKVAEKSYKAGDKGMINVSGLEKFIKGEGKHTVKIKYHDVKEALPYSLAINWNTSLPNNDEKCTIGLQTKLSAKEANVGETVRLTAILTNKKQNDVPSVMALIGIPAGFTAQPWQLKELQEKNVFDYYEIKGNNIVLYYRGMGAGSVKQINLDLKAEMPGEYNAAASSAYLYYTNEFKSWSAVDKVIIKKTNS